AERDADVLRGVVLIDVQIAPGFDADVDPRMPGQQIEHVVEKADSSFDRRRARAVEINGDLDVGFLRLARHRAFAHFALRSLSRAQWCLCAGLLSGPIRTRHWRHRAFALAAASS